MQGNGWASPLPILKSPQHSGKTSTFQALLRAAIIRAMRHLGAPLAVVVLLGACFGACSVINKFEEVVPDAVGGESSGGTSGTGATGGRGGNTNGGSSGTGTSGDGGAPPEGGTGGTAGDAGDAGEPATGGMGNTGGSAGTGGCAAMTTYFRDADEDTYGDDDTAQEACEAPTGYVDRGGDCADDDDAINPGATEVCNGLDENCNDPDEGNTCPAGCVPEIVAQRLHLLCRGPATWGAAKTTCEGQRMLLARIRDSAESVAVRTAMTNTVSANQYWLGGTDGPAETDEGTWRWLVGGDVFFPNTALYSNWAPSEPAAMFPVQDCLRVDTGRWFATECQLTSAFVCEAPP